MSLAIAVCPSLPAFGNRPNASLPTDWPGGMRFRMLHFGLCSAVCAQSGLCVPRCCVLLCTLGCYVPPSCVRSGMS